MVRRFWRLVRHQHRRLLVGTFDHAEIDEADPIRHTAFVLHGCARCGDVEPFPIENFNLTTDRFRQRLRVELRRRGWRLAKDQR